jgi:hypothetical protein
MAWCTSATRADSSVCAVDENSLERKLCGHIDSTPDGVVYVARIVEPVYAFDHIVIPIGSEVSGQVTKIGEISRGQRTAAALNADFTPERNVEVNFDNLELADGRHFPLQSTVTSGSGQVIRFVAAAEGKEKKKASRIPPRRKRNRPKSKPGSNGIMR